MPAGIEITVTDGFAAITFIDPAAKAAALHALLEYGGAASIELDTSGERRTYVVPEGNARAVGLIDQPAEAEPEKKAPVKRAPAKKAAAKKAAPAKTAGESTDADAEPSPGVPEIDAPGSADASKDEWV